MPPSNSRPIQMTARRKLSGLDCIIKLSVPGKIGYEKSLVLRKKLIQEAVQHVVGHHTDHRKGLALVMNDSGRRLVHVEGLAQCYIFFNRRIERSTFGLRADFVHVRGGKDGR